ncbi:hypothetical protein [Chitinophaga solisilvae]|uniref:Uncharacterized protein n=1 Tax=Chitinophaga solisilvae TaxID=1233460 RepID=A0A433WNE6_9BACT|nr:hypothetical protein [Chitinophaga solisilvae]NSL87302.1 hypothetical protein [Chitinophaga solisilvae]
MSYLNSLRLVFSGDFQADVATANNDVRHFDNDNFQARFQLPGENNVNGAYNPDGGSSFLLQHTYVQQVSYPDGRVLTNTADDIVIGTAVTSPADRLSGKLVDLDPQMQLSTEPWGVKLRLLAPDGELLLEGDVEPSGFRDLQVRQFQPPPNGLPLGASWITVLTNLHWTDKAKQSPFLKELKAKTDDDKLSLNLTSFAYYTGHTDGRFTIGKIIGTLGPWIEGEPEQFVPGRRLFGISNVGADTNPAIPFNYSNFIVEEEHKRLLLDLGGSFPVADTQGNIDPIYLKLGVAKAAFNQPVSTAPLLITPAEYLEIGVISNTHQPGWLLKTGGVVSFQLSQPVFQLLKDHQLLLIGKTPEGQERVIARESVGGYLLRADAHVFRLDPGDEERSKIYAYRWGKPLPQAKISLVLQPPVPIDIFSDPTLQGPIPLTGTPPEALLFPAELTTNNKGFARITIGGNDPGSPRGYVDGQVYYLNYSLAEVPVQDKYPFDQFHVHLRDEFDIPQNPAWQDIAYTLKQYGNLFPLMSRFIVDLGSEEAVKKRRDILLFAFTRKIKDPNYMPVTRDLSAAKRKTIVKWLKRLDDDSIQDIAAAESEAAKVKKEPVVAAAGDLDLDDYQKNMARSKSGGKLSFNIVLPFAAE